MDDFVRIRKKNKGKKKVSLDFRSSQLKRIKDIQFDLVSSEFFRSIADRMKKILQEQNEGGDRQLPELVCYGLGNFVESYIARYQLALLLALRDDLQVLDGRCEIYDPKFSQEESSMLSELNFNVLEHNQEGKRECSVDRVTIFYMPHCGKSLYNNLLWRNWGLQLENIVIIGNSFTHMIDSTPNRILKKTANYVIKIQPYSTEIPLEVPSQYDNIFNDTSIHTFSSVSLKSAPPDLWQSRPEPIYDPSDAEIIFS